MRPPFPQLWWCFVVINNPPTRVYRIQSVNGDVIRVRNTSIKACIDKASELQIRNIAKMWPEACSTNVMRIGHDKHGNRIIVDDLGPMWVYPRC